MSGGMKLVWTIAAAASIVWVCAPGRLAGQGVGSVERAEPDPPGRRLDVGGHRLHIHCRGDGAPVVVIDAGAGAWSLAWLHVQADLARTTRVCVYDRAGLGWSDPGPEPRTSGRAARELHALLGAAGERPPFVVAGHSFGGWNVRVFAGLFPDDVAGIALIESAHEDQWERLPPIVRRLVDASLPAIRARAALAERGGLTPDSVPEHAFFSMRPSLRDAYVAEMLDPSHYRAWASELATIDASAEDVRRSRPIGEIPLVVLSSAREFDPYEGTGIPVAEANRIWLDLQEELAALAPGAVHIISRTGPHTIQYAEPAVVAGVIRELVARVRRSGGRADASP